NPVLGRVQAIIFNSSSRSYAGEADEENSKSVCVNRGRSVRCTNQGSEIEISGSNRRDSNAGYSPTGNDMLKKIAICFAAAAALFLFSPTAFPHHGTSDYDAANLVTWHVTVTEFMFINPHALVTFTRKNDKGKVETWEGELQSPSMLARRAHWTKDTL